MYEQIKLSYESDALEPYIDKETVETHHGKHHATYTKNFNDLAEKAGMANLPVEELLASLDKVTDETLRKGLRNQGGGFYNHNLYFEMFSPKAAKNPTGKLAEAIDSTFGSLDALKEQMSAAAAGQFGSGWAWLSCDKSGKLAISTSLNQDTPLSEGKGIIDVWEHAYYLKYKNLRPDYIKAFWEILDWSKVTTRYDEITNN